jgi:hypothetical protein
MIAPSSKGWVYPLVILNLLLLVLSARKITSRFKESVNAAKSLRGGRIDTVRNGSSS